MVYYVVMEIMTEKDYAVFLKNLEKMADGEEFKNFQKKIVNTQKRVVGIRTPKLRKFADKIFKSKHDGLFMFGTDEIFEEVLVKGLVLAKHKDVDFVLKEFDKLVSEFDSWAETDMICSKFAFFKSNEEKLFSYFSKLAKSEKEFVCRFGIVCLMKYFLDESHSDAVFDVLDCVVCEKYYVNMAIAWLICEFLVKKPQNAVENMQKITKNHHFNSFICNKAIQKAIESFRIDDETKKKLRDEIKMIEKNQEFEVEICGYASEGQGIARKDGFVIFVPFALENEVVKIHIIKVTKSFAVGKILEVLKPSPERIDARCPHFEKCGGCTLQKMNYDEQLKFKKGVVCDALRKIGGFEDAKVNDVEPSDCEYFYRNKSAFPLFVNGENQLRVCMFKGLSHNPVFVSQCPIADSMNMKIAFTFQEVANEFFNQMKSNFLHLVVRTIDGKSLVIVVTKKHIKNAKVMFDALKNKLKVDENKLGLFECLKKTDNNVILDGEIVHLFGIKNIDFEMMGVKMSVSAPSFFQVNVGVMKKIYEKVNSLVASENVVDAYSGAGLMSAILSKSAKKVYAIEIVEEATKDAERLKELNKIQNLQNINGDTSEKLPLIQKELKDYVLVLDPPRKGVDLKVVESVIMSKPSKIVYVSCNPATLARDLKLICEGGFEIDEVSPFDMFPQTSHVETVVCLTKIKK